MCCCTDLALESRDYELLFGRVDATTGMRSTGLLDQFNNPHIDSKVYSKDLHTYHSRLIPEGISDIPP
jgi:hypothetical protein